MKHQIRASLAATALTLTLSGAALAQGTPVEQAVALLDGPCREALAVKSIPVPLVLPKGFTTVDAKFADALLGGEAGEAYGNGLDASPLLAVWKDGRCAAYLRKLDNPAAAAQALTTWVTSKGGKAMGAPESVTSPNGTVAVTQAFDLGAGAGALVTHHGKPGAPGGATVTLLPPGT